MNATLNYLIEANACIIVFLLIYRLLLKNETNFAFRRGYLVTALLLAALFPLISLPINTLSTSLSDILPTYWLPEIVIGNNNSTTTSAAADPTIGWSSLLTYLYLTGIVVCSIRLIIQLVRLLLLIKRSPKQKNIVDIDSNMVAFSFFNYICIGNSASLSSHDKESIIKHEQAHQQLGHSFDLMLIEILRVLFWFNPAMSFYKMELCTVHEFQADEKVIKENDIQTYCNLLARVALLSAHFTLANHFNNSLTIKRITMMKTLKRKMHWWKPTVAMPIVASFLFIVACQDQIMEEIKDVSESSSVTAIIPEKVQTRLEELKQQNPEKKYDVFHYEGEKEKLKNLEAYKISSVEIIKVTEKNDGIQSYIIMEKNDQTNQLSTVTKTDDEVFLVVEKSARPVGGMEEFYKNINDIMQYPIEARRKEISGRVFVEFIIQTDGTLSDLKVLKGIGEGCDEEAMRAIKEAGLWTPAEQKGKLVKQRMVMPVNFVL